MGSSSLEASVSHVRSLVGRPQMLVLARAGALCTTYWGGAAVGEPVKVGSYVAVAATMAAAAAAMPEGVMKGSRLDLGEEAERRKVRGGGEYGAIQSL